MTDDARRIDVTSLPEDVVSLIDALGPGDELVITRNGAAIATIAGTGDTAIGEPHAPGDATDYDNVIVVATAMKLSESARASLSAELGTDYIVLDMHRAPRTADVLLVPPVSPQLIGSLRSMFPKARVILAEIEDAELGVSYQGPVRRLLDAGAETYLASTSMSFLARQLDHAITQRAQITGGNAPRLEIESAPANTIECP